MILRCQYHREDEFFRENRLVFGRYETPSGDESGGKEKKEKRKERRAEKKRERRERKMEKKGIDINADLNVNLNKRDKKRLEKLRAEVGSPTPPRKETYEPRHDFEEVKIADPKVLERVKMAVKREGLMNKEQLEMVNDIHGIISEHYMDPAFMRYIDSKRGMDPGLSPKVVYGALDTILRNPYQFDYLYDEDDQSIIVRAKSSFKGDKTVSLKILQGGRSGGYISEVNGKSLKSEGTLDCPWQGIDYQKQIQRQKKRFDYELARAAMEEDTKSWEEAHRKISDEMKEPFVHNNVTIPYRFLGLVKARNYDFEQKDPRVQALKNHEGHLANLRAEKPMEAYRKLTEERDKEFKVIVWAKPSIPDAYIISVRGVPKRNWLVIHERGYIMNEDADGNWQIDPRYGTQMQKDYLDQQKKLKPDAAKLIEDSDALAKKQEAAEKEVQNAEEIGENKEYMQPVVAVLDKMVRESDWPKCRELIMAYAPSDPEKLAKYVETLDILETDIFPYYVNDQGVSYKDAVLKDIRDQMVKKMIRSKKATQKAAKVFNVKLETPENLPNS